MKYILYFIMDLCREKTHTIYPFGRRSSVFHCPLIKRSKTVANLDSVNRKLESPTLSSASNGVK